MQTIPIVISILALGVALATLWLSHLRRGNLRMTKPTVIFFGPDSDNKGFAKVFLRALLYSTGKRGHVLEHLYVRLRVGENQQNFNIWVYGEKELARGSGLFVGAEGVATNHHFLIPSDTNSLEFRAGNHLIQVFGKIVGSDESILLSETHLAIDPQEALRLKENDAGIYFDWGPDAGGYQKKIEIKRGKGIDPLEMLRILKAGTELGAAIE